MAMTYNGLELEEFVWHCLLCTNKAAQQNTHKLQKGFAFRSPQIALDFKSPTSSKFMHFTFVAQVRSTAHTHTPRLSHLEGLTNLSAPASVGAATFLVLS